MAAIGRAACLGPAGSYSELAAHTLCPQAHILFFPTFPAVFDALEEGRSDAAVIPIENSIHGGVLQNLDLLEVRAAVAVAEVRLRIDHRLATRQGVRFSEITRVYSHEQAIGQCARFLDEYLPHAERIFTDSTAKSLALLDEHSAGIVGAHTRAEGVCLSPENIADEKNNFTQFFLLRRRMRASPREPARAAHLLCGARDQPDAHREPSHSLRSGRVPLFYRDRGGYLLALRP